MIAAVAQLLDNRAVSGVPAVALIGEDRRMEQSVMVTESPKGMAVELDGVEHLLATGLAAGPGCASMLSSTGLP